MKKVLLLLAVLVSLQADNLTEGMDALEQKDFKSAVVFFEKAAVAGNRVAQQNLSVMYNNGYGVKKDVEIASKWLNRATNHGIVRIVSRY
jgi:TPR repeat protein